MPAPGSLETLLAQVRACQLCAAQLAHAPRPVLQAAEGARLLIAGQAPGRRVHASGVAFDDPSGQRLRSWLGVDEATFYDPQRVAILPMGFCYPGHGPRGDLPPRAECAPAWRRALLDALPNIQLSVILGQYAMDYHLDGGEGSLTASVRNWRAYWPRQLVLPHPSPRNNIWLRRNPWFERDVIPLLQRRVATLMR